MPMAWWAESVADTGEDGSDDGAPMSGMPGGGGSRWRGAAAWRGGAGDEANAGVADEEVVAGLPLVLLAPAPFCFFVQQMKT